MSKQIAEVDNLVAVSEPSISYCKRQLGGEINLLEKVLLTRQVELPACFLEDLDHESSRGHFDADPPRIAGNNPHARHLG